FVPPTLRPSNTILPYTTLFRSRKTRSEAIFTWGRQIVRMSFPKIIYRHREFGKTGVTVSKNSQYYPAEKVQDLSAIAAKTLEERDRKSTRLNSSHVKSSYAVFC